MDQGIPTPLNLASRLASGAVWKMASMGGVAVVAIASQLALGWLLSDKDFGVYAVAISAAAVVQSTRDGGTRNILVRLETVEFRRQANTGLVISLGTSLIAATILVAVSAPVAAFFGEAAVQSLLRVIAVSALLGFAAPVAFAGLHVGLRFRTASVLEFASALIRYGLTVSFAIAGLGPLSFVLPLLFVNAFESGAGWLMLHRSGLGPSPGLVAPGDLLRLSPWAVLGAWATFFYLSVDNLVLGRLVSTAAVGFYFFGYQIVLRLVALFDGLRGVVVPGFVAVARDRARTERAVEVAGLVAGGIAGPAFMIMAVTAGSVVGVLWHGRWDSSVGAIRVLALAMPAFLLLRFIEMLIQSRGRFGLWAGLVATRGILVGASAWMGASFVKGNDPTAAAIAISGAIAGGSLLLAFLGARRVSVGAASVFRHFVPPYAFAVVVAPPLLMVERSLRGVHAIGQLLVLTVGSLVALNVGFRWILVETAAALRPILALVPGGRGLGRVLGVKPPKQ